MDINKLIFKNDITATFDLETTGTNVDNDRVVQIAITKRYPDGRVVQKTFYINPEMDIPEGASNVHGITNDLVKDSKTFAQMAETLYLTLKDCVLIGFNSDSFDIPLIKSEFKRCGYEFPAPGQVKVDALKLYRKLNANTLGAIYKRMFGVELDGAHDATNDINATDAILMNLLENTPELENMSAKEVDVYLNGDEVYLDSQRNILINKYKQYIWGNGKHKGRVILDDDKEIVDYNNYVINKSNYHTREVKDYLIQIISRQI